MRLFVTGSTGVIGKRIVPQLIAAGHGVTALVHSANKRRELEQAGAVVVQADLFDGHGLRAALEGHDAVINLATHMPSSSLRMLMRSAWRENDRIRSEGSAKLVQAALHCRVQRFIQESFAPVYPDRGDQWIDETVPIEPVRYNRSVADAESSAARFTSEGGIGIVLRFGAFYGPDARQLADIMRFVRRGFAPLLGAGESFISPVAHDDAASAVIAALDLPAGAYNVVDDEPVRHREFIAALADAMNVPHPKLPPPWAAALAGSIGRMMARSQRMSNRKLREASGWQPALPSVREGFRATVAAMRESSSEARAA